MDGQTLWWLSFWTAVGLCVGSFVNVVIYRLPRQRSLRRPLWSACPDCGHRIGWSDNLPILSYIRLRGRCRHCRSAISPRYVVVEAMMAIVVLMLLDAFFLSRLRLGLSTSPVGLTDQLAYDWPLLTGHVVLMGCLLAMSAIDLEHYWVDIRFTNLAAVVGFASHTFWTPRESLAWYRPTNALALVSLATVFGLLGTWLVRRWWERRWGRNLMVCSVDPQGETYPGDDSTVVRSGSDVDPNGAGDHDELVLRPLGRGYSLVGSWVMGLVLILLYSSLLVDWPGSDSRARLLRLLIPLLVMVLMIIREGATSRDSDRAIIEAIEMERKGARRMVLGELAWLLPAGGLATLTLWFSSPTGILSDWGPRIVEYVVRIESWPAFRNWMPVYGLSTAASGFVVAGALGWLIRIAFTLVLGKEAFGTGDIHLMAAIGAAAGWPVVVYSFVLTCALALLGWLVTLPFKRSRALPLGPWISVSALAVILFLDRLRGTVFIRHMEEGIRFLLS